MLALNNKINGIRNGEDVERLVESDEEFRRMYNDDLEAFLDTIYRETVEDYEGKMTIPLLQLRARLISAVIDRYARPEERPLFVSQLRELLNEYNDEVPLTSSISGPVDKDALEQQRVTNNTFGVLLYEARIFDGDVLSDITACLLRYAYTDGIIRIFREILIPMSARDMQAQAFVRRFKESLKEERSPNEGAGMLSELNKFFSSLNN